MELIKKKLEGPVTRDSRVLMTLGKSRFKEVWKKSMEGDDTNSEVLLGLIGFQASSWTAAAAGYGSHRGAEDALQEHMVDDLNPIIVLPDNALQEHMVDALNPIIVLPDNALQEHMVDDLNPIIVLPDIENQYPDQYEIGRLLGILWFFPKRNILNSQKQMKYPIAAAAAIFAANCQQIQSLKGAGTALGQAALIGCTSSWLLTLLEILGFVALPSLSYTKAKLVTGLAGFLTASSHFAFVAMNLGPISKYTIGMVLLAAFVCGAAMLYMIRNTEIESAPAAVEGISTE